jgi:hypothetical protein
MMLPVCEDSDMTGQDLCAEDQRRPPPHCPPIPDVVDTVGYAGQKAAGGAPTE